MDENLLAQYENDLACQDRAHGTIHSYLADLRLFAQWPEQSVGEPFDLAKVVSLDIRSYRGHLLTVKGLTPATINRRLQSLRAFRWARGRKLIRDDPFVGADSVTTTRRQFAPQALDEKQLIRALRVIQQSRYAARDYAILQATPQAGLRATKSP